MLSLLLFQSTIQLPGVSIWLSALVAVIGVIIFFAVKTNGDLKRVGEIMFFCGLLAFLMLFKP